MPIPQRAFHHLSVEGDVSLAEFVTFLACVGVVVVHRLHVVHPWQPRLDIEGQHVLFRRLVADIQSQVLAFGPFLSLNKLVKGTARLFDLAVQLALNQVVLYFAIIVHSEAPTTRVVAHGQIAVREMGKAVVGRSHCGESLGGLFLRNDVDDTARAFRVISCIGACHNVDTLHIGCRDASQPIKRSRHTVHQYQHIAIAADAMTL